MTRPARAATDFQDDLGRLQAEQPAVLLRLWPWMAAALLAALVGLAAVVRIDIVVVATGRLAADVPPIVLKPATSAVLDSLLVRPGDVVAAGDLLARLDPTLAAADLAALQAEQSALAARVARLMAERDGGTFAANTVARQTELAVLNDRRAQADSQRAQLQAEVSGIDALRAALLAEGAGLTEQLVVVRDVETMRTTLAERQTGSQLAVLEARLMRLRAEADQNRQATRLAELAEQRIVALTRIAAFEASLRREITEALADARPRLAMVQEELAKAQSLRDMSDLTAPRPGVVLQVAEGGPGTLIGAGEAVVVLIPTDTLLLAEIGLRSVDAGRVVAGDPVTIKIDAFSWRRHGMLEGLLADVGHASFTPEGGTEALHPGHVTLSTEARLTDLPPGATLLPGMTLTAEVRTGSRTVLEYFLDPVLRGLNESLREP